MVVARAIVAVVAGAALLAGCDVDAPLPARVSCDAVLKLKIGDEGLEVIPALGQPYRGGQLKSVDRVAGQAYDEWRAYGGIAPDMGFGYWDSFDIYLFERRVVRAWASRSYGDTRDSPDGANPRLALSLTRGPDGSEVREIGPAFKDVFGCDPPVMIPAR